MLSWTRRISLAATLASIVSLGGATAATADGGYTTGSTTCSGSTCLLTAGSTSTTSVSRPSPGAEPSLTRNRGGGPACKVVPVTGVVADSAGTKGVFYMLNCGRGIDQGMVAPPLSPDFAAVPSASAAPAAANPRVVAQQAYNRLSLAPPMVELSPSAFQVVGVPTWLWLARTGWVPQSASASVSGVTVTATATPVRVAWDLGDGSAPVMCRDAGTPYSSRFNPASASPDCGYVYRCPSADQPGGSYTVRATVRWSVAWQAQGAPGRGTFPDLASQASVQVQVREVQTLVVRDGSR